MRIVNLYTYLWIVNIKIYKISIWELRNHICKIVLLVDCKIVRIIMLWKCLCILDIVIWYYIIDPFPIRCATSVPLGKGTKFALHHGKMSTTKRRAILILHISMFQFTFKCGYNDFISKYTDINSLHVTQIDLLHNDTFCSILNIICLCQM